MTLICEKGLKNRNKLSPAYDWLRAVLVAGNGRLKRLSGMLGAFGKLMAAQRGQVLATVTSARPLDESTLSEVRSALHKMVAAGRSLQIDTRVRFLFI